MTNLLRGENLFLFIFSIFLFSQTEYVWWVYLALFLLPDIGMIGYVFGSRVGAVTYNFTHFIGVAVTLMIVGTFYNLEMVYLAGIIILGHAAFDRIVGYGLKYPDSFKHTHLGWLK